MKTIFYILLVTSFLNYSFSAKGDGQVQRPTDNRVWISIGSDAADLIEHDYASKITLKRAELDKLNPVGVSLVSIPESKIDLLSEIMHQEFKRCGGFFYHQSFDVALKFSENAFQLKAAGNIDYSINNAQSVERLLGHLTSSNMISTVDALSGYFNRYYTQDTGVEAANWIKDQWSNISNQRDDISISLYEHSWPQPSVILTITGTTNSDETVIVGGHLDSVNGNNPDFGRAPGSDDNASGIALLTETLNAIVSSDFRPEKTIQLIAYAAEEVGLRGSQEIANEYYTVGKNIVGVAQFDMTGFNAVSDEDIIFINDYTDEAQTQFMAQLLDTYHPTVTYGFSLCGYACSDHAAWTEFGYASSFPFESSFSNSNPTIHTPSDTNFDVEHALNFVKLSVTYLAELAKGTSGILQPAGTIQFAATANEVTEGGVVEVVVERIGGRNFDVSIDYTTVNDTAIAGEHFNAANGTLSWSNNESERKIINIQTHRLSNSSLDTTFLISLSNPQGGTDVTNKNIISVNILDDASIEPEELPKASSGGGVLGRYLIILLILLGGKRRNAISL